MFSSVKFEGTTTEIRVFEADGTPIDYNARYCEEREELNPLPGQYAQFLGTYKAGHKQGNFILTVFEDEGAEADPAYDITGDNFALEVHSGPYTGYTRAGYIECGYIEVRN